MCAESIPSSKSNKNAVFCNWIDPYPVFLLLEGTEGRDTELYFPITLLMAERRIDLVNIT